MNNITEEKIMIDKKPLVTCAGELEVFASIEDNLMQALVHDSAEWKRSLGRPIRSVHIGANFTPFSPEALPKGTQWDLIRQPLFHIYWTECNDVDIYKATLKEDIEIWFKALGLRDIQDWLIVVVENYDGKRANKLLPRTTVLDKIRADFASKQGDRCISVINPGRPESKSTESWKGLVGRIRHLLLVAYAKAVSRLEDYIRQQREKRNDPGWNFMKYFYLQEELAHVLEMVGLHDEALIQYDELDALFSQFVVNGITSESVKWLNDFQRPLDRWYGLKINSSKLSSSPSILELRAYLFTKQAQMLLFLNRVWQMASRCLPFLHTCTRELGILDIQAPTGALACWQFLAAMEVLQTCDKYNHADEVADYSLHTAGLWAYASQKLRGLGELCGLLPGSSPTSGQLHIVVGLSAGMGDNPGTPICPSPTDKLKEALCSQEAFNKTYLELAELGMGTYKHTGRIRSARLVGREVASFYLLLGETQKAAAFLGDAIRTFEQDGWHELAAQTQLELAECYRKAGDDRKFVKSSARVSAALEIDTLLRWSYFDEMMKFVKKADRPITIFFSGIIKIVSVTVLNSPTVMQDSNINVQLMVESNFPKEILCTDVVISVEKEKEQKNSNEKYCVGRVLNAHGLKTQDPVMQRLRIQRYLDYKQDKQLASASVVCKYTDLKRKDSTALPAQSDFSDCLKVKNLPLILTPGLNIIRLSKQANKIGRYYLGQIAIDIDKLHLVSQMLSPRLPIQVDEEGPTLRLLKSSAPLLAHIEQKMNLILTIGSYKINPDWKIRLAASQGLSFQINEEEPLLSLVEFAVGDLEPFSSIRRPLRVLADLLSKDYQVSIFCPWAPKPIIVNLNFTPPLTATWKLHTVKHKKFVQINLVNQCQTNVNVDSPKLILGNGYRSVCKSTSCRLISPGSTFVCLWEILVSTNSTAPSIKSEFNISYEIKDMSETKLYKFYFEITDYQTQYILEANVEPAKGSEFCRVGILCHLRLIIQNVHNTHDANAVIKSVMYEVLAEQSVWAVCGRTAGVVSFESELSPQVVELDVMPLTSGYLPLPLVRISKYIPAEFNTDKYGKSDSHPKLEPFSPGQVYNSSKGKQVHVIIASNDV